MLSLDTTVIIGSLFIAFYVRLGNWSYPPTGSELQILIYASPLLALPIFTYFGLYRNVTRYIGFNALLRIAQSVTLYSILWGLIAFMVVNWEAFPRSVILINWLLVIAIIGGSRLFSRWLLSEVDSSKVEVNTTRVVIYGAGLAGRQLSTALKESREYKPMAFIDDANEIYNYSINGLNVFSPADLMSLIEKKNIKEVFLAMPSLTRVRRNEIINYLEPFQLIVRSLPSISELAQGKVTVNDLLEVDIRDLLGRDSVTPNKDLLKINIKNKVVLVTGAGGSIGSELCRQIVFLKPKILLLFDISESSIYLIEQELISLKIPDVEINPLIGSVSDLHRVKVILDCYSVQTIYHAAAYKHVPLVEFNPSQGVLNNAIGTMVLAEAAIYSNVEIFVLISTDKAVRPTSVMGASKRIAELVLQSFSSQNNNTCFTMVRFGNVLDSSGSVIPLFKKQIKAGGPVTVTHPDIVRYFMTISEAVELVIQAGAMAKGGDVFLLDMGEPIRIYDLAVKMIKLSGLVVIDENNPKGDIEIKYTGLRPGEKLFEELLVGGNFDYTQNKLIMRAEEEMIGWDKLEPILVQLKDAATKSDTERVYKLLLQLVPKFSPIINLNKSDVTFDNSKKDIK